MGIAAAILALSMVNVAHAQSKQPSSWPVIYVSGPAIAQPGARVFLTISEDSMEIQVHDKKQVVSLLTITAPRITRALHTSIRFNEGKRMAKGLGGIGCSGPSSEGCGAIFASYLVATLIAMPMHGNDHYVTVEWNESGVEQQLMLQVNSADRTSVIEQLQQLAGDRWLDLEAERHKVEAELVEAKDSALPLLLDRASRLNHYELRAGDYSAIILHRSAGTADLYVMQTLPQSGSGGAPGQLKAAARVETTAAEAGSPVEYEVGSGDIAAIHFPDATVRIIKAHE